MALCWFAATATLSFAAKADECPPRFKDIEVYAWTPGTPDQQGLIDGKPNPNLLHAGDDILFTTRCDAKLCGWTVELTLLDERMRVTPVTFANIPLTNYFRAHPATALTEGTYTLRYVGTNSRGERCDELTYVFRVEAGASSQPPAFQVALSLDQEYGRENGEPYVCDGWLPHSDTDGRIYLNARPYRSIELSAAKPITDADRAAFLTRTVATQGLSAGLVTGWTVEPEGKYWPVDDLYPTSCFVVETMQVNTLQVSASEEHCFTFVSDGTPYAPLTFNDCAMGSTSHYARAWCETNSAACSTTNPHATDPNFQSVCATYPNICAPFLGKRSKTIGSCP